MDKLTAAKILGIEAESSIDEIKAVYREITKEIQLEDDPERFALVQTAYRTLTKKGGTNDPSFAVSTGRLILGSSDYDYVKPAEEEEYEEDDDEKGHEEDDEKKLFADIIKTATRREIEKASRESAREEFFYLLQNSNFQYDFVRLLELGKKCDLDAFECAEIAKSFTKILNVLSGVKRRTCKADGFNEFVSFLYLRMGKKYNPRLHKLRNFIVVIVVASVMPMASTIEMMNEMKGHENIVAEVASFAVCIELLALTIVGAVLVSQKLDSMNKLLRIILMILYIIVAGFASALISMPVYVLLK